MILYIFLVFNCAMFPNTNLVEIIFPQSFDRFRAVAYGKFFIVTWMDSITERIRFSGMVKSYESLYQNDQAQNKEMTKKYTYLQKILLHLLKFLP